jgi:hypothetical protein
LKALLDIIVAAGYQVILDLGSALTELTLAALRRADITLVVTSGQPVANKLHDAFISSAGELGLDDRHLLPVINLSITHKLGLLFNKIPSSGNIL